jgi:hypothetical protein
MEDTAVDAAAADTVAVDVAAADTAAMADAVADIADHPRQRPTKPHGARLT